MRSESQAEGPLPPQQVRQVSMTLVAPRPSWVLDVPPMQTPQPSNAENMPVAIPYKDPEPV